MSLLSAPLEELSTALIHIYILYVYIYVCTSYQYHEIFLRKTLQLTMVFQGYRIKQTLWALNICSGRNNYDFLFAVSAQQAALRVAAMFALLQPMARTTPCINHCISRTTMLRRISSPRRAVYVAVIFL